MIPRAEAQGQIVDLQMVPVSEFQIRRLPGETATDTELAELAEWLTAQSAAGYQIVHQGPGFLLLGKQVGLIKLSVDVGRVVLPFTTPAAGARN